MRAVYTALTFAAAAGPLAAQETLLPTTSLGSAPVATVWHFATPIKQSAGGITDVAQFAVPVRARAVFGERWTFDLIGAASTNAMLVKDADSTRVLTLNGLT